MHTTEQSVGNFLASVPNEQRRQDALALAKLMQDITGETPKMWGPSIVGFGTLHYKYATGRGGDTMKVGFAPRKDSLVLYGLIFYDQNVGMLKGLGPHKAGKGCLYIKRLSDVDLGMLKAMIDKAYKSKEHAAP